MVNYRGFLKLAFGATALVFALGGYAGGHANYADADRGLINSSFFHTEGRDIVSDMTGEKVVFRGVNLNGLEFGSFSDHPYPGVEGTNYFTPRAEDLDSLKALGSNVIRVPFEWARLVTGWRSTDPLPTALDPTYLVLLDDVVQMAAERELYVILDMHDFLKYWSGQSDRVCVDDSPPHQQLLARTWKLLAARFRDDTTVLGYDIMNQPVRQQAGEPCGSCSWHTILQSVVDTIRTVDENHLIFVEGPNFSLASDWPVENGKKAFIRDGIDPPRIVYSPHVFFDFNNDSRYDHPGEEIGPIGEWQYYVRDRLLPVINWSIDTEVPVFIGETNVPCTAKWAAVLDTAFFDFFEPFQLSVTAWHYVNPEHCSLADCPLNLTACPEGHQLEVLKRYPGGPYQGMDSSGPMPLDSRIYDDVRVNPWDAGDGFFGDLVIDFCASDPVFEGNCSIKVHFNQNNFAGVKFIHHYGIDTRPSEVLSFWIYPTDTTRFDFKIFTTAPRSDCDPQDDPVYPPTYDQQPTLRHFLDSPLVPNQWQLVEIPLDSTAGRPGQPIIIDPNEPIVNGIAFQNMGMSQKAFYVDNIRMHPVLPVPVELTRFVAVAWEDSVELQWTTASETNNVGFDVERSTDGRRFGKIAFVRGSGTTAIPHTYSYVDRELSPGTYYYRLKQLDINGTFEYSGGVEVTVALPVRYALHQNYPNPFNPTTTIRFQIPKKTQVALKVFNVTGQTVATLLDGKLDPGHHQVPFEAVGLASGAYFYKLVAGDFIAVRKMMLVR